MARFGSSTRHWFSGLADTPWRDTTRASLAEAAAGLDTLLAQAGLEVIGGTSLFRLVRTAKAAEHFEHLGRAGIFVRRFPKEPSWLRFGLPGGESEWQRLSTALASSPMSR